MQVYKDIMLLLAGRWLNSSYMQRKMKQSVNVSLIPRHSYLKKREVHSAGSQTGVGRNPTTETCLAINGPWFPQSRQQQPNTVSLFLPCRCITGKLHAAEAPLCLS